jgi:single-strand DNA-binding protein
MSGTPITIVGNLTGDPELRFTPSGAAVTSFTVAVNDRRWDKNEGKYVDAGATYWKCNIWRQYAENIAESLTRGQHVFVTGTVSDRTFETRDGEKRTVKEIDALEVGPTLRFGTAKFNRVARENSGNSGTADSWSGSTNGATTADDPWATTTETASAPF